MTILLPYFPLHVQKAIEVYNNGNQFPVTPEDVKLFVDAQAGFHAPQVDPINAGSAIREIITEERPKGLYVQAKQSTPSGDAAYICDMAMVYSSLVDRLYQTWSGGRLLAFACAPILPEVPASYNPDSRVNVMWSPTDDHFEYPYTRLTGSAIPRNTIVSKLRLFAAQTLSVYVVDIELNVGKEYLAVNPVMLYNEAVPESALERINQKRFAAHDRMIAYRDSVFGTSPEDAQATVTKE